VRETVNARTVTWYIYLSCANTGIKNPRVEFSVVRMMPTLACYLLSLFEFMMVARDRIELLTRGFSVLAKPTS
jgi:hypothetical protein